MSRRNLMIRSFALICILAGLLGGFGAAGDALSSPPAAPLSVNAETAFAAQLVSHIGGLSRAVAVDDARKLAFVGIGRRLVVINYATPTMELVPAGQTLVLPNLVNDIFLSGGLAYLAIKDFGLMVVNTYFTPPLAMPEEGRLPLSGNPTGVAVKGTYAYMAIGGGGLKIIDVSNPAAMEVKQTYAPTVGFSAVRVTLYEEAPNTYAFVSAGTSGLFIVDITDPLSPATIYNYLPDKPGGAVNDAAVMAPYAYLVESPQFFRVLDITELALPQPKGSIDLPWYAPRVAVNDTRAYVANNEYGIQVLNINNKDAIVNEGRISSHPLFVDAVALSPDYVFATGRSSGLHIFNLNDIGENVGSYYYNPGGLPGVVHLAAVRGTDYLFTAGNTMDSYRTYRITDPGQPEEIGLENIPLETSDVAIFGNYAFVPSMMALYTITVYNPDAQRFGMPDYMDPGYFGDSGYRMGIMVAGTSQLYFAPFDNEGKTTGILQMDVNDWNPTWPAHAVLNRILYTGPVCGMAVDGNRLYAAAGYDGLLVFDMTNPSAPVKYAIDTPGYAWSVAVNGGTAYVGDATGGLRIFNVTDLANITALGAYTEADWGALDVAVRDHYVYLTDYRPSGSALSLKILDVAQPSAPVIVGYYDGLFTTIQPEPAAVPPEPPFSFARVGIALAGDYIYVADYSAGLNVLYFAPPITATIGSQGGQLVSAADNTACDFPGGTFAQDVTVTYAPRLDTPATQGWTVAGIDHSFEIGAFDSSGQPVQPATNYTITVSYDPAALDGRAEDTLAFYYWDGEAWVKEPTSQVDTISHTITAAPGHFSLWTTGGAPHRVLLPAVRK